MEVPNTIPIASRSIRPTRAIILAVVLATTADLRAQHLLQAALDGLGDPVVAREAGLLVGQQEGVLMARFDVHTRNMMLRVTSSCTLDQGTLNAMLAPLGVRTRCLRRMDASSEPFRHIDPDRCTEPLHEDE